MSIPQEVEDFSFLRPRKLALSSGFSHKEGGGDGASRAFPALHCIRVIVC